MCSSDVARIVAFIFISIAASVLLFWFGAHLPGGCEMKTIGTVIKIGC